MVSEKQFLKFSHYKSIENLDPRGGTSLDPRVMVSMIYVRNQYIVLHTKYISCERRIFIKFFSHYKSMETLDPQRRASFDPRGMVGRVYVGDH